MSVAFSNAFTNAEGQISLPDPYGTVALIAANLYVALFNGSWGPVMWVMLGEMFPNQMRGSGLSIAGLAQWLANFGITISFPILLTGIGLTGAYGIYAFFAIVSVVFIAKMVQETKGLELEDMDALWNK